MDAEKMKLDEALCDVRKAYRLLNAYQTRIRDLMICIQHHLDFPNIQGRKLFSNPIYPHRNEYFDVFPDMWSWDYMYGYMTEFYFGEKDAEDGGRYALSVIHYSDTGYFDSKSEQMDNEDSFIPEEKSESKLLFYFEYLPKKAKDWIWNVTEIAEDKSYASSKHIKNCLETKPGQKQILYSFNVCDFIDEKSTLQALEKFISYCQKNGINDLEIV